MTPVVSFVVPCYKFAHLLTECVHSILKQTYTDLEVIIMDDCSPDNTSEVAQSFNDPRVRYIRNEPNLGSLRNYNKGIGLAQGKYVWLISADDYLRRPYTLERYVKLFEANPNVGYVYCPGVEVVAGKETGVLDYSIYGGRHQRDQVVKGTHFLHELSKANIVVAASGLVRKECYEKHGLFPLDPGMIWAADWYMWCMLALYYDVGYLAEPMVCYRKHVLSMTNLLEGDKAEALFLGDIAVPWMIKKKADQLGLVDVSRHCLLSIAHRYALRLNPESGSFAQLPLDSLLEKFEVSLSQNTSDKKESDWLRARVYVKLADHYYWRGDRESANRLYRAGLNKNPRLPGAWFKNVLLKLGPCGNFVRNAARRSKA